MNITQPVVVAIVSGVPIEVHIWQIMSDKHIWYLNVYWVGPEEGLDLSDAQLL